MIDELQATKAVIGELARHLDVDICIELWDGSRIALGPRAQEEIRLVLASPRALRRLITDPSLVSIAELFAAGDLDVVGGDMMEAMAHVDHLQFRFLPGKVNKARLLKAALPILLSSRPLARLAERFTARLGLTPEERNDKELIRFHYDLSNDFYALFLGEAMLYSSAYFHSREDSLDQAQSNKADLICRKLRLQPGDRFWDTGCGWGGVLCHAAQHYGVTALGTTLSQEQYDYVTAKVDRMGLSDRVTVLLRDCRTLGDEWTFDKVAQVEMIEHIGLANHQDFYAALRARMRPRGLYYGQASQRRNTRNPADFPRLTPYMKFIVQYIFPGGEIEHVGMTCASLEQALFEVHEVEALREHFGLTAQHWYKRLHARQAEAEALVGRPKTRLWLIYLSMVALSFQRGALNAFGVLASSREPGASGVAFDRRAEYLGARRIDAPAPVTETSPA
jgi:cyclopropane-fatty-acyl-phospholipid synthase